MPFYFPENFKEYYYSSRKWFFIVLIIITAVDIADGFLKGSRHMASLGLGYAVFISVNFILSIVAIYTLKELLHGIIAIILTLYQIGYLIVALNTL
jgi:hypothetical protein